MSCEDTPARLTWEIQLYEPCSRVWICKSYGRATTSSTPGDIARAVLAGYLAATAARTTDTFRVVARTDAGGACTVTVDQLAAGGWETDPAVRQALPLYLRDALPAG
ncbi:hypothetical protein [Streptomyces violaceus]|uniref:Uncharacterized protein n=1 Tax=Streptomyces violaceus TaxID=1936 RepID=A0ABY9UML5_STRVL|nr:hypothetical protein [Streptomyces janthinus]WND24134.1 hypothetical protein RI060_43215 [Streptomyces janthinus]GGS96962.1 hypothetical protein GCM10010270_81210 [Streptomyces janthinus]